MKNLKNYNYKKRTNFEVSRIFFSAKNKEKNVATYLDGFCYSFFVDAQKLVEDMEKERRKLDKQLDLVQEKTKRAYLSQEILEAKMKVGTYTYV